ncbi:MAG: aminoacyl-tRNA hydrolase [Clostridia bacterium]|nr:aminoacyl-tRNA hydrolase [Clostridia bacterium]
MIIVGLGNYGLQYKNTRHNAGFMALTEIANKEGVLFKKAECKALVAEVYKNGKKHILAKPQTYMNLSGLSVKELAAKYKVPHSEIVVIVDDIALPLGNIRIRKEGSAGSHNGLKSIIKELGGTDFVRIRIGVGEKANEKMDLKDYVLSKFGKTELEILDDTFKNVSLAVSQLLDGESIDIVMGKYNTPRK